MFPEQQYFVQLLSDAEGCTHTEIVWCDAKRAGSDASIAAARLGIHHQSLNVISATPVPPEGQEMLGRLTQLNPDSHVFLNVDDVMTAIRASLQGAYQQGWHNGAIFTQTPTCRRRRPHKNS